MRELTLAYLIISVAGCGPIPSAFDAGAPKAVDGDAGDTAPDSGSPIDAGVIADAGPFDAGSVPDAGAPIDAGIPFDRTPVHQPVGALCNLPAGWVPDGGRAATFIDCDVAAGRFSTADPALAPATLKVVAWNVEFGKNSTDVLATLTTRLELKNADVLLLSEVARDSLTSNPQKLDQARVIAEALGMDYLFAVEWDRRELPAELGEHGVAILSKWPLGNVSQTRHTPLNDWWKEDKLYGGRLSLGADVLVRGKRLRVYATHLCTRGGEAGRATQAAELRADATAAGRSPLTVAGGDLNTYLCNPSIGTNCTVAPGAEQAVEDFLANGFADGTAGFNGTTQVGAGFFPQRLDWLFARGLTVTAGAADSQAKGSDHLPIYTRVTVP